MDALTATRRRFLGGAAATLATAGLAGCALAQTGGVTVSEGNMPQLDGATGWLNSEALTTAGLRGKVVLVNFWTYTCINWLRQLPYVRAWADTYRNAGLVVLGVHTPEFSFEHNIDNVRRAAQDMQITYPIATDNNYAVWSAFTNNYWPALYFVDAMGRIRHHHFGEGAYDESERVLQQLLTEAGARDVSSGLVSGEARGAEVGADWDDLRSPECYLGLARTENFASPGGAVRGSAHAYTAPPHLELNHWALTGNWTFENEPVVLSDGGGSVVFQFHARDVNLVMGPTTRGRSIDVRVSLDGQPAGAAHGFDLDDQGRGSVTDQRLHQLIRQPLPVSERRFEIEFLDSGVSAYAFTFG